LFSIGVKWRASFKRHNLIVRPLNGEVCDREIKKKRSIFVGKTVWERTHGTIGPL